MYERMVALVKNCLQKSLQCRNYTMRQIEVILAEVACIINNRPITAVVEDTEILPVRPADFLALKTLQPLWDPELNEREDSTKAAAIVKRWRKTRLVVDDVWKRFYKEYLLMVREYHYGNRVRKGVEREPHVGEVVLIDETQPLQPVQRKRDNWRLAAVMEVERSADAGWKSTQSEGSMRWSSGSASAHQTSSIGVFGTRRANGRTKRGKGKASGFRRTA